MKPKYLQITYVDALIKQTLLWMNGVSIHVGNECCIDFSCCFNSDNKPDLEYRRLIGSKKLNDLHKRRTAILNNDIPIFRGDTNV